MAGVRSRHSCDTARRHRRLGWVIPLVVAVALAVGALPHAWNPTSAAFSSRTTNSGNTFAARSSFPSYPSTILAASPVLYHREEAAPSSAATSTSADTATSPGLTGTYNGPTDGPSTWWKLDDDSGTAALDSSGAANPGTLSGTASWTSGQSATGVAFDGAGASVLAAGPAVTTSKSFSVALWAYRSAGSLDRVLVGQDGARRSSFALRFVAATSSWAFSLPTADTDAASVDEATSAANTAPANAWTHLTGVYDASTGTASLYVNGSVAGTAPHPAVSFPSGRLVLGRGLSAGVATGWWSGSADNVRMFRRALSASEVSSVAANAGPGGSLTLGLPGALYGAQAGSTALGLAGTVGAYVNTAVTTTNSFTYECWFKVSGTAGGALLGFSASATGASTSTDRLAYLDSGGHLVFGIRPTSSTVATIASSGTFNDGIWHHLAVSLGAAGMKLYADGVLLASDSSNMSAIVYSGYPRLGGMSLAGYPNRPASDFVIGSIDEGSLITAQLSDAAIAAHYDAR